MIPVWVLQLILALMILVTWHELGHFLPAKWFKARVEKFIIFFDPYWTPIEKKIGETIYGFGWLPLGGYVKISGMIDESMDKEFMASEPQPWEFRSKKAWQRFIIMIGGIFMNVILAFFLFGIVFWVWGKSYLPTENIKYGMHVSEVMKPYGFQDGDVIVGLGNEKLDRYDVSAFMKQVILGDDKNVTVLRDGKEVVLTMPNDIAGALAKADVNKKGVFNIRYPFVIDSVLNGKPAEEAGLQVNDKILSLAGEDAQYFLDFSKIAAEHKGQTVPITFLRPSSGGQAMPINYTGNSDTLMKMVAIDDFGKIGVAATMPTEFLDFKEEKFGFWESMAMGHNEAWAFLGLQVQAFGKMFKGEIEAKENLGSIISIGKMYGNEWDWQKFWTITAGLSMLLAFINLLPIPGLDGGYVFFLIWEMMTGRRISDEFMIKAVNVGFFLLLGLMIYALGLDIWRNFIR